MEAIAGIVHLAYGFEQALDHVVFVVKRQLDGDRRQLLKGFGFGGWSLAVAIEEAQELVAVDAVYTEESDDKAIGNQAKDLPEFHRACHTFSSPVGYDLVLGKGVSCFRH